jgi:hypothetical protein
MRAITTTSNSVSAIFLSFTLSVGMTEQESPGSHTETPNSDDRSNTLTRRMRGGLEKIKTTMKKNKESMMQQRMKAWHPVLTPKYVIVF